MCLGIPGRLVELMEDEHLARVDVNGVGRIINVALLEDEALASGDWVLIHVGFAMSKIDEDEARETLHALRSMGQAYVDELDALANSDDLGDGGVRGSCASSMSTGTRPRRGRSSPTSPSSPASDRSSSWRCAAGTRTRSIGTDSSICSRSQSSWCMVRAARSVSSRWAASMTPSPWRRRRG